MNSYTNFSIGNNFADTSTNDLRNIAFSEMFSQVENNDETSPQATTIRAFNGSFDVFSSTLEEAEALLSTDDPLELNNIKIGTLMTLREKCYDDLANLHITLPEYAIYGDELLRRADATWVHIFNTFMPVPTGSPAVVYPLQWHPTDWLDTANPSAHMEVEQKDENLTTPAENAALAEQAVFKRLQALDNFITAANKRWKKWDDDDNVSQCSINSADMTRPSICDLVDRMRANELKELIQKDAHSDNCDAWSCATSDTADILNIHDKLEWPELNEAKPVTPDSDVQRWEAANCPGTIFVKSASSRTTK